MSTQATELGALFSTRRWLMVVGTCVWISTTLLIARYQWLNLSTQEHIGILIGSLVLLAAVLTSKNPHYLWLFPVGQVCFVTCAFIAPAESPNWMALTALSSWLGYFLIALSSRKVGLFFIPLAAVITIVAWHTKPNVVVPWALEVFGGWAVFVQLFGGAAALWWAWNTLKIEACEGDSRTQELEFETSKLIALQERAQLWRNAANHIHESVLNTLRYALTTQSLDRARLKDEIAYAKFGRLAPEQPITLTLDMLAHAVTQIRVERCQLRLRGEVPELEIADHVFEALRAALVELVRNVDRHSPAGEVDLTFTLSPRDNLAITIAGGGIDNGLQPPGFGRTNVLHESLAAIRATMRPRLDVNGRGQSVIEIAVSDLNPPVMLKNPVDFDPFDKVRLLVTAPLSAMSAFGFVYFIRLMWLGSGMAVLSGSLGLIGIVIAVVVVLQRKKIHTVLGSLLVIIPALVPFLIMHTEFECGQSNRIAPILTISGYVVIIVAAWSGAAPGALGLVIWTFGGWTLVMHFPSNCRDSVSLALLNSLFVLPTILIVSFIGARAYRRAAESVHKKRELEVIERSRADAASDLNSQLDSAVVAAIETLESVANGAAMTDQVQNELALQDGRIRSVIQVDPERDGAFAILLRSLVEEAAELGIRTNVKAVVSSYDTRPVEDEVQHLLFELLKQNRSYATQAQVFTDGVEDHLVLTVSRMSLQALGMVPGQTHIRGNVSIQVEGSDDGMGMDASLAVIMSRRIIGQTQKST